jgi:hypothetical protein
MPTRRRAVVAFSVVLTVAISSGASIAQTPAPGRDTVAPPTAASPAAAAQTGDGKSRMYGAGRTLSDGSFDITGLLSAPYVLATQAEGGLFAIVPAATPGSGPVTMTLRPGGRVAVKVTGPDGLPASNVTVSVSGYQGRTIAMGGFGAFGQTDKEGQTEIAAPAGSTEIMARTRDRQGKVTVTVPVGGVVTAEVTLGPLEGP